MVQGSIEEKNTEGTPDRGVQNPYPVRKFRRIPYPVRNLGLILYPVENFSTMSCLVKDRCRLTSSKVLENK